MKSVGLNGCAYWVPASLAALASGNDAAKAAATFSAERSGVSRQRYERPGEISASGTRVLAQSANA